MIAYELLAKCRLLTLWGQDEDGDLEWAGTKWNELEQEEQKIIRDWELRHF